MKRWLKFLAALSCIAAIWLVALPLLAQWPPVRDHIKRMQAADIQVDAMFYTELNSIPGM